jgi:hypothetical protein
MRRVEQKHIFVTALILSAVEAVLAVVVLTNIW